MDCLRMGRRKQGGGGGLWLRRLLFALALGQPQLHQHSRLGFGFPPVIDLTDDGASSGSQSGGGMPWSLEESSHVPDTFSDIWALIERPGLDWSLLQCQPKPRITFQPFWEKSQKLAGDEAAKAVDAMVESTKEKQGLAAPAIAAGMAAIGGAVPILGAGGLSAAAAVAGSAAVSAAVAASFGAAGARLTGIKMARRISDIDKLDLPGIENVDLSEMVDGHTSYLTSLRHILQGIDIDSLYATQPHKLHMSEEAAHV